MNDTLKDYHFDSPQETLDFLMAARYFRYHPDDGLRVDRVPDEYRSLRLSPEQLNAIDPRLVIALDFYFHNKLPSAALLKESIRRWRQDTPLMLYPADIDVGGEGEDKFRAPPAYWNQSIDDIAIRVFSNKQNTRVRCVDVQMVDGVQIVVRAAERFLARTEESLERLLPGTGARYRSALEMCAALHMRIDTMKDHIFPQESISSLTLPALDGCDEASSITSSRGQ